MTDEVSNLILEHLRAIRGELADLNRKVDSLTLRMSAVEGGLSHLRKEISLMNETIVHQWTVLDQYENRITRIEKRLDLIDTPSTP